MDNTFGDRLRKLREERRMSRTTFAHRIGVTVSSVDKYENDFRKPSYEVIVEMRKVLNVSYDCLFGASEADIASLSGLTQDQKEDIHNQITLYLKRNELF